MYRVFSSKILSGRALVLVFLLGIFYNITAELKRFLIMIMPPVFLRGLWDGGRLGLIIICRLLLLLLLPRTRRGCRLSMAKWYD